MPAEKELEVKMAVADSRLFAKILADPALRDMNVGDGPRTRQFEAFYYDTADFSLQQAGIAYRIRREGEEWVATVKCDKGSGGALFNREELNENISSPDPSLKYFAGTNLGERLSLILGDARLQMLFSTKFNRTVQTLRAGAGSLVELALDHGMIWSGSVGCPISEVEIELKDGCTTDLLNLAGWLAEHFHLQPEPLSKYARGLALLDSGQTNRKNVRPSIVRPVPSEFLSICVQDIFAAQSDCIKAQCVSESIRAPEDSNSQDTFPC